MSLLRILSLPGPGQPEAGTRSCLRRHRPAWARSCSLAEAFAEKHLFIVKLEFSRDFGLGIFKNRLNLVVIWIFVMSEGITLVTALHSCLVTGLHSWVTVSTYWVSHTVSCSVQQLGEDTGAGAGTDTMGDIFLQNRDIF